MKGFLLSPLFAVVLLFATSGVAFGAEAPTLNADLYFGHIEAPCADKDDYKHRCKYFTQLVECATAGGAACANTNEQQCTKIDEECVVGKKILKAIFGSGTYRETLPDFIVYVDDSEKDKNFTLKAHEPLLMWQGKNTPHLKGARAIYILVLAHHKLDNIQAHVTSDSEYEPNPLIGLLGVVKAPNIKQPDAKRTESKGAPLDWHHLNGGDEHDETNSEIDKKLMVTWAGIARIEVPDNSINRVTVTYDTPPKADDTSDNKDSGGSSKKAASKNAQDGGDKPDKEKNKYSGDFVAETGHFSNSPDSFMAVSFALGTTFNSRNTSIASGGSTVAVDGFMFAKFYISRPYLYAFPQEIQRYKPSVGVVIGTNINGGVFNDIVVGVSYGHLTGNVGVIVGMNSIAGVAGSTQGRKNRALLGLEYTF